MDLGQLIKSWEKAYQNLFGIEEMTYNTHVFTHAELIRQKGPWPELSAFTFEDHYNQFKKWYADGTFNQPKQVRMPGSSLAGLTSLSVIFTTHLINFQIMYNLYSSMISQPCTCVKNIHYEVEERGATDDTRIYTYENGQYSLYKLVGKGRNSVSALQVRTRPWEPLLRVPDFGAVGIFETVGTTDEVQTIAKMQIKGKFIMVGTLAVTVPNIILRETC